MMLEQETSVLFAAPFACLIMLYPTDTTKICYQKDDKLVVVPFAANEV